MDRISDFLYGLIVLTSFLFTEKLEAQQTFNHVFNPMGSMVNDAEKPARGELCLNGTWQFMPVFETDMTKFVKPETFRWDSVPLKVPSPWNVNSFAHGDGGDFVTFPSYPQSWEKAQMGWMRKTFQLPENWAGKQIKLHFEAIAGFAKIYVNGQLAGENLDIFFPTEIDVTKLLKPGENEVLVGVAKASLTDVPGKYGRRNYVAGSFWGQHIAGIWQDVALIAVPKLAISNVFVQPDVRNDQLSFAVTIKNNSPEARTFSLQASVLRWEKPATNDVNQAPADNGVLKEEALRIDYPEQTKLGPGDSVVLTLSKKVTGSLKTWTPDSPNLYGALISLTEGRKKEIDDVKYTRFGWRQFTISGTHFLLNGKPIVLKGDSWHFMGIPQMTRRYAWAWFKMLKDANANAVRLHAQPYPSFYLDVADEMGICVLDETGIWSSDGGPKMDSDEYWVYCKKHVKSLVMRDRNHPSVFGWSVCNETLPVVINVFHAPESIVQRQIQEINNWIKIVRSLDQTRDWISGDGEDMRPTDLPTVIGHYGNENSMKNWSSHGKPWGVGETGMGYYGTPKQISSINGDRAYESQQGRMEGLAAEAYDLIGKQQKYNANYTSVFNLVWYGLKPLALGLRDTTRAPKPEDGIFFTNYQEGAPGVQPERLGPYCTTLNPGYDPNLPLYEPWSLFYAVQAINANPVKPFSVPEPKIINPAQPSKEKINAVGMIGDQTGKLKEYLTTLGVPFTEVTPNLKQLPEILIVDGSTVLNESDRKQIAQCVNSGGKVLIWGLTPETVGSVNAVLPYPLKLTERNATSFLVQAPDEMLAGLGNKDFYFTELIRQPVMHYGLDGELVKHGTVLVEACNTDWARWNSRPEYLKTAAVYRSERESKPAGAALVRIDSGKGGIYLDNIDLPVLKSEGEELTKTLLTNIGVVLKNVPANSLKAFDDDGILERAYSVSGTTPEIKLMDNRRFVTDIEAAGKTELIQSGAQGSFDLGKRNNVCLSFWIYSPRSLVDLLVEPDMPKLGLTIEGRNSMEVFVNGTSISIDKKNNYRQGVENLPLEKGWNHILVALIRTSESRRWAAKIRLESNKPEFMKQLISSVGQ